MKTKANESKEQPKESGPKSVGSLLVKTRGDEKDRLLATTARLDELKKRVTVGSFLSSAEKFYPPLEKDEEAKTAKSKWTVAGAVKQLKTGKITLKFIMDISTILKVKENAEKFVAGNGYEMLVDITEKGENLKQVDNIKAAIVFGLWSNLGIQKVYEHLAERSIILNTITCWAHSAALELKRFIYYFLAAFPFQTDDPQLSIAAYTRVTNALEYYRNKFGHDFRFQHQIMILRHELNDKIVQAMLFLFYMIVNLPGALEDRIALRTEFRKLDIDRAFKRIQETPELDTTEIWNNIKTWKADAAEDQVEYKDFIEEKISNSINSLESCYATLEKKIDQNYHIRRVFLEILKSLLHLPIDKNIGLKKWNLVENIVRQLSSGKDEITFDNDNYYDVVGILQGLSEDASKELESLRVMEESQKQLEELSKMRLQLKKIQGDIEDLKLKEKKRLEESEKILHYLERDKKLAEEERQELEIQFKKATEEQKKTAENIVQNLHKERGLASQKKKDVELKRREMEKIIQEQEEEKRKMIEELRASVEEEKQEEIKDAQKDFQEEADYIQEDLSKAHQKEIKDLSTKQKKGIE